MSETPSNKFPFSIAADPSEVRSAQVKGFGCRPVVTYPRVLRAGVRKPPRKEPAGLGGQLPVYGDLTGRRLGAGDALAGVIGSGSTTAVASLALRRRSTGDFSLIDGIGRGVGGGGATAMRRRKRGFPAGGRCNEAVMGVMGSCP